MSFIGKCLQRPVSAHSLPCKLSKEQLDYYWEYGYLIIRHLYDVPKLNIFRDRFIQICDKTSVAKLYSVVKDPVLYKQDVKPEMYINKIQEILYDKIYMRYSEDPGLLLILTQLIDEDITAANCMLINKPPGTRNHPTHQDLYYLPFRPADKIVGVWTAIDHSHQNNGCLYVIPGSHKKEKLYHHCERATEKKQFYLGIENEETLAPLSKRVHLEMQPGDTVFIHPYLLHGSGANVSKECRKALTAHYANSACQYIDVTGTPQEYLAKSIEQELKKRCGNDIPFVDLWRMKCKQVKGVCSHL